MSGPEDRHGTRTGYRSGCRCDNCRAINAARMRAYRARTGDRAGKARHAAEREAVRRYRHDHPGEWLQLLRTHRDQYLKESDD